ncbi:MAG: TetR family transcriptional regulator [Firmicutes bacterium]|nr:TetR family transcriptional regulator [Bacillota bacterium]
MARSKGNNLRKLPPGRPGKNLTASQKQAAELFAINDVNNYSVEDIAKKVGVSKRTVYRWKKNEEFIAFTNIVAERAMEGFLSEAYSTLKAIIRSGKSDSSKLKGIELVLKNRGLLTDVQRVEATIQDNRSDEAIDQEIEELERLLADMDSDDQQEKAE